MHCCHDRSVIGKGRRERRGQQFHRHGRNNIANITGESRSFNLFYLVTSYIQFADVLLNGFKRES
jgi:hypothetical protein